VSVCTRIPFALAAVLTALGASRVAGADAPATAPRIRHELEVRLDPAAGRIAVADRIRLPGSGPLDFSLNASLTLLRSDPPAERLPPGEAGPGASSSPVAGQNSSDRLARDVELARYRVELPPDVRELELEYEGPFDFGLESQEEEYARGIRETAGIVSAEGVYLAGAGHWYPVFDDALIEFRLEAALPEGWHLVAQGAGESRGDDGVARWDSAGPTDEIYLVGGPLIAYRRPAGTAEAQVYLRSPDPALAERYLEATARYLEMYSALIGPYPYGKFALIENFWETGYGMPSFTLLGSQVIRLPFILASSYPHEILHNWWGNSVFVDYESGNWCEGLTAYLADHLIQEQGGRGAGYRRDALQRYASHVSAARDFPLVEFRSRHSAATEAVGYGKTSMGFHALRRRVGDEAFRAWLASFYREQRGRRASFADVRASLERVTGVDLGRFFREWTEWTGAPALEVAVDATAPSGAGYRVAGRLRQIQDGPPYELGVPLVVQTAGGGVREVVRVDSAETPFALEVAEPPLALHVDPEFDLFRRLEPLEIPPSIGQLFGEPKILAVLPAAAAEVERTAYRALVEGWASAHQRPEFVLDDAVDRLPADRGVWLLGRSNRFAPTLFPAGSPLAFGAEEALLAGERLPFSGHSLVAVARHPGDPARAAGWIVADPPGALPGLGRKLPHYGKYSYLGFEGHEPANVLKGQWSTADSPLVVDLRPPSERSLPLPPLQLDPAPPLVPALPEGQPMRPGRR